MNEWIQWVVAKRSSSAECFRRGHMKRLLRVCTTQFGSPLVSSLFSSKGVIDFRVDLIQKSYSAISSTFCTQERSARVSRTFRQVFERVDLRKILRENLGSSSARAFFRSLAALPCSDLDWNSSLAPG